MYIFLFITESKFYCTKYYTKSRMLNPLILHEIKGKGSKNIPTLQKYSDIFTYLMAEG